MASTISAETNASDEEILSPARNCDLVSLVAVAIAPAPFPPRIDTDGLPVYPVPLLVTLIYTMYMKLLILMLI